MRIYLDNHATTPCDPRVVEAMLPTFSTVFGNAASRQHAFGHEARALVEEARGAVAALVGAEPREIIFTSGATEADNLAVKGAALAAARASGGCHIVTSTTEHKAVLDSCGRLEREGFRVTYLPVAPDGRLRLEDLAAAIAPDTVLVSVMLANNETGTLQPVREIGALCKERGVLFHSDAVQGLAHLPCDVEALGIDLLSISAHKLYGPKGAGALYVRRRRPRARLEPIIDGGGHERGLRSGTLNVPGIVGLGKACELARLEREGDAERLRRLRDRLRERLLRELPGAIVNGSWEHRLPNNLNISLPGLESERLIASMPEVAVSSGAACTSASFDSSYVLRCLGQPDAVVRSSLRFGLGRFTTEAEIERAADLTIGAVLRLRGNAAPLADNSVCGGR